MARGPSDIARLGAAHINVLLAPETGESAARHLEKTHGQLYTRTLPIGAAGTRDFIAEVQRLTGLTAQPDASDLRLPWWTSSVDSTYLTGKRVFLFGEANTVIAMARVARDEMGFEVVGMGAYNREFARPLRAAAKNYGLEALITDDHLTVEEAIEATAPEMILGTQMERHIGKRLGIPCAVISAPVHVQDFPARYSPVMGFEGANVLFDTLIHPLVMGLEEHLLTMFREDFEFSDAAGPSHHGGGHAEGAGASGGSISASMKREGAPGPAPDESNVIWLAEAEAELRKVPFFVRGKARRNTEAFASERGVAEISVDTLYEAKAHYAR